MAMYSNTKEGARWRQAVSFYLHQRRRFFDRHAAVPPDCPDDDGRIVCSYAESCADEFQRTPVYVTGSLSQSFPRS